MKSRNLILTGASALILAVSAAHTVAADTHHSTSGTLSTANGNDRMLGPVERANKLIGKTVYSSDNEKVGKLDNLVIDLESGRILYAIVGTGTLGIGGHDYAVAPGVFSEAKGENLHMSVDKSKFTGAPEFSSNTDKPDQLGQASFISQVYQYFGQPAWWQGGNTATDIGSFHNVHKAKDVIGMKVKNVENADIGKVDNVIVNLTAGRVPYVILNPDSSLNLGGNYFALPPNALTWNADQKYLVSDLTKDKLAAAPHFGKEQWQSLSDPAFGAKVYGYFGKQAYFESGLQPTGSEKGYQTK
jgi:sporulation protein YlmC with PRC-barrel domain